MAKKAAAKKKTTAKHGGDREGSGRPSWFNETDGRKRSWSIRITTKGYDAGENALKRLKAQADKDEPEISRNVLVDALIRKHAGGFTIAQLRAMRDK